MFPSWAHLSASSPLHSLLPPAAQFLEPVGAYDRICRPYMPCWQGWPQPSRQTWSPSFQFPAECCSRPPETWTRGFHGSTWQPFLQKHGKSWGSTARYIHHDHLLPWPSYHLCPGATTTAAKPRAHGYPTPWQLESQRAASADWGAKPRLKKDQPCWCNAVRLVIMPIH